MKKKLMLFTILAGFSISNAEEITNPILKKLVEKGILTKEEAIAVEQDLRSSKKEETKEVKADKDLMKHFIYVENKNSPNFLLGKETIKGLKIKAFDNPDMWIKVGVRVQGTFEKYKKENRATGQTVKDLWDAYLRRARLEISAGFSKNVSFSMDIRNDKANYQDKGEESFNIGDAYLKIKKPFGTSLVNFKIYRGKLDVSRTETVKSAWVIHYDRPHVADEAAQFVSHNRRATNIQMYGNWKHKIAYQIAIGDGIYSGKFHDAVGNSLKDVDNYSLIEQDFMYGGKLILSPIPGWEEKKRTETYFGEGQHFEVGVGYWRLPHVKFRDSAGTYSMDRTLLNYEMSAHYKWLFVQAEYFDFDGVERNFKDNVREVGKSKGWYITGEVVLPKFYYIAPFARYESWTKWDNAVNKDDYKLRSRVFGVNWYLRGNTMKLGIAYQLDDYGKNIGNEKIKRIKLTSQLYF